MIAVNRLCFLTGSDIMNPQICSPCTEVLEGTVITVQRYKQFEHSSLAQPSWSLDIEHVDLILPSEGET